MRHWSPPIKAGSSVKATFDGNSLVAGQGGGGTTIATAFSALAGSTVVANTGVGGASWDYMTANNTAVDAAFDGAKSNVLFIWEDTNAIFNDNQTAQQTIDDCIAYVAARKAAHPAWKVVRIQSIPRRGGHTFANEAELIAYNETLDTINAHFAKDFRAAGIDAIVDTRRPGSPFRMTGYTEADFLVDNGMWSEALGAQVHLNATGYTYIGGLCWDVFRRLRA